MIGKLKGTLSELEANVGLIETEGGVSYLVFLTPSVIKNNIVGGKIEIYTYFQVRDDAHVLFGFVTRDEERLFKLLLTVPGVGPKTAFTVVSFADSGELFVAITENNSGYFTRIPGLGKKTALKIILELSQKLKKDFNFEKLYLSDDDKTVLDALISLGFKSQEAQQILSRIPKGLSIEEKIKAALKVATNPKKKV